MKIVFMGTPDIGAKSLERISKEHEISLVITQPDKPKGRGKKLQATPIKIKAEELNIPVFQPENINTKESIERIEAEAPDLLLVIAYGQILSEELLKIPEKTSINLHASLLPKYRGASPIQTAIIEGEKITGITVMEVKKALDAGDIIAQEEITIENKNALELSEEMGEKGAELLSEVLNDFDRYYEKRIPQDESKANFCKKLKKEDGKILWTESASQIKAKIMGCQPFPIAFTDLEGLKFKIYNAEISEKKGEPGVIEEVETDGIIVGTGEGSLKITELQIPGKRRMSAKDFLLGNKIQKGEKFK